MTRNCLEIKLKALGKRAFVQLGKSNTHRRRSRVGQALPTSLKPS